MTKIKLCGLSGIEEMEAANELKPEYIGFVFAPKSRRYVTPEKAAELKKQLSGEIQAAGVLRQLTGKPIIKAFQVKSEKEIADARQCSADYILLDSGAGTGTVFDWNILKKIDRPYFLAGGLSAGNVGKAVRELHPFAVDVSSGIETDRRKDKEKMAAFVAAVRKEETL